MSTSISTGASSSEDVWFVDSGASNHMTSHLEWFRELREPDQPGYVETGDNTTHPIRHIGNVPFGKEGNQTCIKNVLHVQSLLRIWSSSAKLLSKGWKFDLIKAVASLRKRVDSSLAEEERAECSFSTRI